MEGREEKMLRARASFQNEGSFCLLETKKEESQNKGKNLFLVRGLIAFVLFGVFVYGDVTEHTELNEISRKSYALIQKSEINIKKYSAFISRLW